MRQDFTHTGAPRHRVESHRGGHDAVVGCGDRDGRESSLYHGLLLVAKQLLLSYHSRDPAAAAP